MYKKIIKKLKSFTNFINIELNSIYYNFKNFN